MFEIRTITEDDADLFRSRLSRGFGKDPETDEESRQRFRAIFDYDRTFAIFDDAEMIGTGGAFSLGVTVPGGATVPMGGTTVITVQPTHRRRGVLRMFMDRHLDDVAEHDEPLAGLWASEGSIYGRFGFGPSTYRYSSSMSTRSLTMRDEATKGRVQLLEPEDAEPIVRDLYEKVRAGRAGMLTRSDPWWAHRHFADPESWREGKTKLRYVVFEENGSATGYATYRQKAKWEDFTASGEIDVEEMMTTSASAHAGLWGYLSNVDLFTELDWWNLPVDDPLPQIVTDQRHVNRKVLDGLWIRLMDVPIALEGREYESDGVVTFEVVDPTRPSTSGVYRLEAVDGEGTVERVQASPDLTFDADVLGHLYLGGGNAISMKSAGRIEGDTEAVARLHRLFRTDRAPWCPEVF